MSSRSKDIILLLGAGASAEAGIPTSATMIGLIEGLLTKRVEWNPYCPLYNHVKSAIHFASGIKGQFNESVQYNIETLVNTLYELERNEEHPVYPFIAGWDSRFVDLAKRDFSRVREFRRLILAALKKWMCPEDTSQGDYYRGLVVFQQQLNFPLRIFSLNYDLCVERLNANDFRVETGFGGFGPQHVWDWQRFEDSETSPNPVPQVLLYKLHGSINWKRDQASKNLFCVEQIESVEADSMELIFGRDFKLEAADPYLFYTYEFRRFALIAKLIVVVGYGFGDTHINKMLTQALRDDPNRKLVVVGTSASDEDRANSAVAVKLELSPEQGTQVDVLPGTARVFLQQAGLGDLLLKKIPAEQGDPF